MKPRTPLLAVALFGIGVFLCLCVTGEPRAEPPMSLPQAVAGQQLDRSPIAVALSPDRRYCAAANHTADSVSLVDLKTGRVLHEHHCGDGPADVVWIDEKAILVSLATDDAVALLHRKDNRLRTAKVIPVGDEPRGIALSTGGKNAGAFVAVSGEDRVAVIDLDSRKVVERLPVGGVPRTLAVAPNGRWLVTCCNVPGEVWVHDAASCEFISRRTIFDDGFNLSRPVILPDSSQVVLTGPINRTFPVSLDNIEKGWVIDNRLTKLPLPDGKYWQQKQLGLDTRGQAAGDANAVAFSPDGNWLAVSCGGSHELLVIDNRRLKWPVADPGDFVPFELLNHGVAPQDSGDSRKSPESSALRHVKLGGRPVDVRFLDDRTALVANYLSNSLQVIDVAAAKIERTIDLGGPEAPSLARRGEAIFYDADRSFDSWFSCHTCHFDGHTSGQTFDTLNDGNYDTYKLVPSLQGVVHTGPWTWHGWQTSLSAGLRKSMRDTLHTRKGFSDEDVEAMLAYLASLTHPLSPRRADDGQLTEAAGRGRTLFEGKAGCIDCHAGAYKTTPATYTVGLESNRYFYAEFNPPSLRGVHSRRRFLHDGRADSLQEVLTRHHQPQNLTGEKLTDDERRDLIAYLLSL